MDKCEARLVVILLHWCQWNFGRWNFLSDAFCYRWCLSVWLHKNCSVAGVYSVLTERSHCFFSCLFHSFNLVVTWNLHGTATTWSCCMEPVNTALKNVKTQKMPCSVCSIWRYSLCWRLKFFRTSHLKKKSSIWWPFWGAYLEEEPQLL